MREIEGGFSDRGREKKASDKTRVSKVTSHPARIDGSDALGEQPEAPRPPKSRRLPPGLALATVRCGAPWGSGPWSWEALTPLSLRGPARARQ